ncbi:AI-2E family transporter [Streptomyces sp. RKND-216]|uniref:AI-2E family transporter n=1 Tax=Streptomyces sp. RKND-216 TaxID=2562581 RepID=UPI00109E01A1|nr:AI-2E family transporter [Streptomyces sp. RKND-216]THA24739.1 AI-2E family transporter [Streptomyces sp. RKND-216]
MERERRVDRFLDGVQKWAARAAERRARATMDDPVLSGPGGSGSGPGGGSGSGSGSGSGDDGERDPRRYPAPPSYAPAVVAKPEPAAAIPWGMRVAAEAGWRLLVLAGVIWVLTKVVSTVSLLIIAFSAGLLITALLQPTVARLRRLGVARGLATLLTFIMGTVFIGLIGWFVAWQIMENLPTLTERIQDGIEELKRWAVNGPFHVSEDQVNNIAGTVSDWIGDNSKTITSASLTGVTVVLEFFSGALLAMFVTLFLLYDGRRVWDWTLNFVPAAAREGVAGAGPRAWVTLTGYVRGTVIVALIDGLFIGIGLYFLDVPMAVPLAVLIFLFSFVPIVGAVTSGALAVLVALVTNGLFTSLLVLAVVLAVQQIESHILQPFILGRLVRVHPLGVVLSVTAGGLIAGIPGAVVAVPLVAVTNTAVGYLRAYAHEQVVRRSTEGRGPGPYGATVAAVAPTSAPSASTGAARRAESTTEPPAPEQRDLADGAADATPGAAGASDEGKGADGNGADRNGPGGSEPPPR